jgi:hypothetical protein
MSGYSAGSMMIDGDIIRECTSELQIFSNVAAPRSKKPTVIKDETLAEQPKIVNYIDIPEKRSNLKLAGIYFIFLIRIYIFSAPMAAFTTMTPSWYAHRLIPLSLKSCFTMRCSKCLKPKAKSMML